MPTEVTIPITVTLAGRRYVMNVPAPRKPRLHLYDLADRHFTQCGIEVNANVHMFGVGDHVMDVCDLCRSGNRLKPKREAA